MSDWITDELLEKTRKFLGTKPEGDKRQRLSNLLGVTEYKAGQLIRAASISGPTWCVFDLETTSLAGDFGRLLCGSILSYPSMEMVTYSWPEFNEDPSEDAGLALAIRNKIEEHNFSCGYHSKGFDIPFLNARLAAAGLDLLQRMYHYDAIWAFRGWRGLKVGSSSMKNVADFFDLEQKVKLPKEVWVKAGMGNKTALQEIIRRCESDVRITWELINIALDNKILKSIQMYP